LLLVFAVACAAEATSTLTTPVNIWVVSGSSITVEGQSFTIYLSSRTNEIMADYGQGALFIMNNSCEASSIARICVDNIQYDFTDKVYKIKIRGISLAPSITITRDASKSDFLVGDETTFSVTLKNAGGLARNVTYEEALPKQLEIASTDGILFNPRAARWTGSLETDEAVTFSYNIKALDSFDGSLVPSLTYLYGQKLKTVYGTKIALKASPAMVLAMTIGDSSILGGEHDNVTINLTNRLPETASVSAEITFDPGLQVVSRPYGTKPTAQSSFVWNGDLVKHNQTMNISKALFFEVRGTRVGSSSIRAKVSYSPESNRSALNNLTEATKSIAVTEKGVVVRTSLKDSTLEANQGKTLKVWLQNLNPYMKLKGVSANVSTGMVYLPYMYFDEVGPEEQVLLAEKFFYAPAVTKSTGYTLETNVTYLTEFGDNFTKTFKDTATVAPPQEVSITQALSSQRVKSGDDVTVTVGIRNSRLTKVRGITIFDNLSPELELIGKNHATLEAGSKESVNAYTYKITAPHVDKQTVFYVNTTMQYSDAYNYDPYLNPVEHVQGAVTALTVQPEVLPLTITRTVEDASLYVAEPFNVVYVITNTATDKVAKNIMLKLPLTYEFDRIGGTDDVAVGQLGPGESIAVTDSDKERAKLAGSLEIGRATLEYQNVYGDNYSLNSTLSTVKVTENYLAGPVILLEKKAPAMANNTDTFPLQLRVKNIGTDTATVTVLDGNERYVVNVLNGTEYNINRTAKIISAGKIQLPQATASYRYNGDVFTTASKPVTMQIVDNPVISISKSAPANATNIELFSVLLQIRNRANKEVKNVTVSDGSNSWTIPAIKAQGAANLTFENELLPAGQHELPSASASYTYEGSAYDVQSNTAWVSVEEERLISVSKWIAPNPALSGAKVKVTVEVKNSHNEALDISITDNGRNFLETLLPGEEKNFTYELQANSSIAAPASASYSYKGQQLAAISEAANFTLSEKSNQSSQGSPSSGDGGNDGFFSKLIKGLQGILTWKRGG